LAPKSTKYREFPREFELTPVKVIQGHRSWCQSKAHKRLPIKSRKWLEYFHTPPLFDIWISEWNLSRNNYRGMGHRWTFYRPNPI